MKKIAVADVGEFWYGDYKEPLVQLEGAIPGYPQGVVLKDDQGALLCAYCGRTFENLAAHVRKHGLSGAAYKREVGLLRGAALFGERTRQTLIRRTLTNRGADRIQGKGGGARGRRQVAEPRTEALNKSGRCYAQTLAAARSVAAEHGGLSIKWLARHGIRERTVAMHFGSLDNLARIIGAPRFRHRAYTDDQLLTALRGLAVEIGATPAASDLRRYGLPSEGTYRARFGSYLAACNRIGLRPSLRMLRGAREIHDADILSAYAATGSSLRAAKVLAIGAERVLAAMHRYGYPFPAHYNGTGRREWAAEMAARLVGEGSAA